jgi:hypothetical protein
LGLTAKTSRAVPVNSLAKVYEARVEDYTRAAEQTDDQVFRRMLLTLALQFTLAAQEEGAKSKSAGGSGDVEGSGGEMNPQLGLFPRSPGQRVNARPKQDPIKKGDRRSNSARRVSRFSASAPASAAR